MFTVDDERLYRDKYGFENRFYIDKYGSENSFDFHSELKNLQHTVREKVELERDWIRSSKKKSALTEFKKSGDQFLNCLKKIRSIANLKFCNPANLAYVQNNLEGILAACDGVLKVTPNDKGGRKFMSARFNVIVTLASIYERGTGKEPKCYRDEHEELGYNGDFYNFLVDVSEKINLLGSPSKIGEACRSALKHYKKIMKEYQFSKA